MSSNSVISAIDLRKTYIQPGKRNSSFEALRGISFEVGQGEVLGVIGRNGAGKSSLLKVLSGITVATSGQLKIDGRVACLLEVGTGFHQELTGFENIFFNAAILGMKTKETKLILDEIIEFSGIEKFIHRPIREYSTGMVMRLGFSVAAFLKSEILILDEILAVGDVEFQDKCLAKVDEHAKSGRTIVFVSHSTSAVQRFCSKLIWLDQGKVQGEYEDVRKGINDYLRANRSGLKEANSTVQGNLASNEFFDFKMFSVTPQSTGTMENPINITMEFQLKQLHPSLQFGFTIFDAEGQVIFMSQSTDTKREDWPNLRIGNQVLEIEITRPLLQPGVYTIKPNSSIFAQGWLIDPLDTEISINFEVIQPFSESPYWISSRPGLVAPLLEWKQKV